MEPTSEISPFTWMREAWEHSKLELLVPAAAGMALAQLLTGLFALHSYHTVLLWLVLAGAGYTVIRTFVLLYRLNTDAAQGARTTLYSTDLHQLFGPMIGSVALYGMIAPNIWLGIFYALVTIPHFLFLLYFTKRHAVLVSDTTENNTYTEKVSSGYARISSRFTRAAGGVVRVFRKTPDFSRP